jgi:hypothetical protein
VSVKALIGGAEVGGNAIRRLEERLLEKGVNVARTPGDLVRYHGKMMIVDRAELYVLAFNFTYDIEHSRSFGIVTGTASSSRGRQVETNPPQAGLTSRCDRLS